MMNLEKDLRIKRGVSKKPHTFEKKYNKLVLDYSNDTIV